MTRLPAIAPLTPESQKKGETAASRSTVEYSSREVSSPALLTQQLVQAHYVFTVHHGPSLTELFVRLSRDKFCSTLERYWNRFCRTWDVLLHGNPAADVFSGLKLASGGELGFGVGEEDWGSGEREVLEDVTRRTEGLIDTVVSRFGEPDPTTDSSDAVASGDEALPWMGSGSQPIASDGIVFGGVGAIARPSLRNLSLWMREIYTYGEYAYGVHDNPLRERRKRRRRNPPEPQPEAEDEPEPEPEQESRSNGHARAPRRSQDIDSKGLRQRVQQKEAAQQHDGAHELIDPAILPKDDRPQIHGRIASRDHALESAEHTPPIPASHPGVPRPIVTAAEQALDRATHKADQDAKEEAEHEAETASSGTTMGIPDQYIKYLTFGLSELGKTTKAKRPSAPKRTSTSSSTTLKALKSDSTVRSTNQPKLRSLDEDVSMLTQIDPMPDGETLRAKAARQRRQETKGHFIIGLKGDLDDMPEGEPGDVTDGSFYDDSGGSRTVLRTIQLEVVTDEGDFEEEGVSEILQRKDAELSSSSKSVTTRNYRRMRVLVYVRRPFIYCFLFDQTAGSLSYPQFYREMHRNLQPIHKPLLSSTSVVKVAQRIEGSHGEAPEDAVSVSSAGTNRLPSKGIESSPIFDLIYDPRLLTLHTSIPNVPEPGTPAAEGLVTGTPGQGAPPGWTRVEALSVHSQILNTLSSVKHRRNEIERTSKTNRGWWIVWMRVPPSAPSITNDAPSEYDQESEAAGASSSSTVLGEVSLNIPGASAAGSSTVGQSTNRTERPASEKPPKPKSEDMYRTAFLVRKSTEAASGSGNKASAGSRMASGMWASLTLQPGPSLEEKAGGASAGWGPAALAGGIGFDARRYVEGLLSLNR